MSQFRLFTELIANVELGLAKADLSIARLYAGLVTDAVLREQVFGMLFEEFERTKAGVLRLTGQTTLLEKNPVLARSIRLRERKSTRQNTSHLVNSYHRLCMKKKKQI